MSRQYLVEEFIENRRERKRKRRTNSLSDDDSTSNANEEQISFKSEIQTLNLFKKQADEALTNGNFFEAISNYGNAIEMNPFSWKLREKRAQVLFHKLKKHKEALEDAEYIILLKPNSVQVNSILSYSNDKGYILKAEILLELGHKQRITDAYLSQKTKEHLLSYQTARETIYFGLSISPENSKLQSLLQAVLPFLDLFLGISDELLIYIFSFLNASELCIISRVCKKWNGLGSDNHLWKSLFFKYYGDCLNPEVHHHSSDWKKRFERRFVPQKPNPLTLIEWNLLGDWMYI